MTQQFTASEVHDWERAYKGTGAAKVFGAFADLLEAQEKAVPVAWMVSDDGWNQCFTTLGQCRMYGKEMIPLYTHPAPSDAEKLAEALRAFPEDPNPFTYRRCYANARAALTAQAQPTVASVTDAMAVFEVVSGVEGPCLTISRKADGKPRHEYRLAGPKPWGGGNTTHSFKVHTRELREQIDAIEAALATQENPNG